MPKFAILLILMLFCLPAQPSMATTEPQTATAAANTIEWQGVPPRIIYGQRVQVSLSGLPPSTPLSLRFATTVDVVRDFTSTAAGTAEFLLPVPRLDDAPSTPQAVDTFLQLTQGGAILATRAVRLTPAARWLQLLPQPNNPWAFAVELQDVDGGAQPVAVSYELAKVKRAFDWQQTSTGRWHYTPDFTTQRVAGGKLVAGDVLQLPEPPAGRYVLRLAHTTADGTDLIARQILISDLHTKAPDGPAN